MATKTDRILARLPRTFRALPPPTALHALADAFGGELQRAENALAEVMQAHWVDHADRGADEVHDLAGIAALYGLAPRAHPLPEETVEEFRARLKSHVRTFLEGTTTLGGVLRVAADALGLRTEEALDGWWNRAGGDPVLTRPRGDDAAALLFGAPAALARGRAATPARADGPVLPAEGADLRGGATLRLSIDGGEARDVHCAAGAEDRARVPLSSIVAAIDAAFGAGVAGDVDGRLVLRSPSAGASSSVEVHEVPGDDAAPVLLGLPARRYVGRAGEDARIAGRVDLPGTMDLRDARYLRMTVDRTRLAEVDCCAGADPAATTPQQVADAISAALGPVASIVGGRLVLASRTPGAGGSLVIREAAAQDAAGRLLGDAPRSAEGRDPAPAEAAGAAVLPGEMDLSTVFAVRISVDGRRPVTVDCAGVNPAETTPMEAAARLAAALAPGTARYDGVSLHVASGTAGPGSTVEILPVTPAEDAGPLLFGLRPRIFRGADAAPAVLHGTTDLAAGVDVRARGSLGVAVDGAPPVEVDLAGAVIAAGGDAEKATAAELARAINEAVGEWIAASEGERLVLASNTRGTAASVELVPLEARDQRPFVTRAFVAGEAASVLLGVPTARAAGTAAETARIVGTRDLRRGVDLRPARWLRLSLDGAPAVDVDCGAESVRPRAALGAEIAGAINAAFPAEAGSEPVASLEGGHLVLTSRRAGGAALLRLEPPRARDARTLLLGHEPGVWRGADGRRVVFAGTADLAAGVDLSAARRLRLRVDGLEREADCAGANPAATALPEIVTAINTAFGRLVARGDGAHLVISSGGPDGGVEVLPAGDGPDAAPLLLGIVPPRVYRGEPPAPARVRGTAVLAGPLDLSVTRFLRIAVDGGEPVDVDAASRVAARTPDPAALAAALGAVSPMDVADALNDALGPGVAEVEAGSLVLRTRSMGSGARIELLAHAGADAREALFGDVAEEARGTATGPASIDGTVELWSGADLSSGRTLRIRVDGGRAVDVDAAGAQAGRSDADEVVSAINRALPGLASLTAQGRLRLASPTTGPASALEVLPVRVIEVVEYPAEPVADAPRPLRHGQRAKVRNDGAHRSDAAVEILAAQGAAGPALADPVAGTRIRYLGALGAGDTLRLARDPALGVRGEVLRRDGSMETVPPSRLLAGSASAQAQAPFDGARRLTRGRPGEPAALRLDDPWQPRVVALRERTPASAHGLEVQAAEHALPAPPAVPAPAGQTVTVNGRVRVEGARHVLVDRDGGTMVTLLRGASGGAGRHIGRIVAAEGTLHAAADGAPVLAARRIDRLYDVTVRERAPGTQAETFAAVSLGSGADDGLVRRVVAGPDRSTLVIAADEDKGALLRLERGATEWVYTECHGARFDHAHFVTGDEVHEPDPLRARFPGASCVEMGILDVSRLAETETDPGAAALANGPGAAPPVSLTVRWTRHRPGAFELRLPAHLPDALGARLDQARLGIGPPPGKRKPGDPPPPLRETHEVYGGVVTEPADDAHHFVTQLAQSKLVTVEVVPRAPIGWRAVPIPFRRPRVLRLSGGRDDRPARIYVTDPDVPVVFAVMAKAGASGGSAAGAWGNLVEIGVGPWVPDDGVPGVDPPVPGRFQVTVGFAGARVEGAREAVRGGVNVPPPGPVGVLHARAAGVAARVVRERAEFAALNSDQPQEEEPA